MGTNGKTIYLKDMTAETSCLCTISDSRVFGEIVHQPSSTHYPKLVESLQSGYLESSFMGCDYDLTLSMSSEDDMVLEEQLAGDELNLRKRGTDEAQEQNKRKKESKDDAERLTKSLKLDTLSPFFYYELLVEPKTVIETLLYFVT